MWDRLLTNGLIAIAVSPKSRLPPPIGVPPVPLPPPDSPSALETVKDGRACFFGANWSKSGAPRLKTKRSTPQPHGSSEWDTARAGEQACHLVPPPSYIGNDESRSEASVLTDASFDPDTRTPSASGKDNGIGYQRMSTISIWIDNAVTLSEMDIQRSWGRSGAQNWPMIFRSRRT